jgi:hypothetical protein
VRITIPAGQYVPRFIYADPTDMQATEPSSSEAVAPANALVPDLPAASEILVNLGTTSPPVIVEIRKRGPRRFGYLAILLLGLALAVGLFWPYLKSLAQPEVWQGSAEPAEGELRVLAGFHGIRFNDRQGRVWLADRYYNGGVSRTVSASRSYEGLPDQAFVRSRREGTFRYDIPVVPGTYELRLYFIETEYGEGNPGGGPVNVRMFNVGLNGKPFLELFDALSEAGAPNRIHVRVFRDVSPANDGKVHLSFQQVSTTPAFLNALELLPTSPGHVRPIRIVAQKTNVTDSEGALWQADQFAVGGTQVDRSTLGNEPQRMLFRGERFGNFSYRIPVASGKYRLRLYFAETYFGTDLPYARNNPAGPRIFNVFANGVALIRNFNITADAGGTDKPLVKEFENLEPNAQGLIVLEFIPVHNYAEVNAIEVLQME